MDYPLTLPGFEGRQPVLRTSWFKGPAFIQGGVPAPKAKIRGAFVLQKNDGTTVQARPVQRALGFDPVPDVEIDGHRITLVPPLRWWQWLLCSLPLILVFAGGAAGALIGAVATYVNVATLRSGMSAPQRYLGVLITSLVAILVFWAFVVLLRSLLGR